MKAALFVMTILGCNDAGTACEPVATRPESWATIAACNAASDRILDLYQTVDKPMVVAVCQTPGAGAESETPVDPAADRNLIETLADNAVDIVEKALPTADGIETIVTRPVRILTDTYSWVARKVGG